MSTHSYFWPFDSSSKTAAFIVMRSTTPRCWSSSPSGPLDGDGVRAQPLLHRVDAHEEVGADLVHLVNERDARHVVLVGLTPDRLALGLDAVPPSKTATAPSSTRRLRSTSMVKSTWPGVSMMLMRYDPCAGPLRLPEAAGRGRVIVIPRSCSWTI